MAKEPLAMAPHHPQGAVVVGDDAAESGPTLCQVGAWFGFEYDVAGGAEADGDDCGRWAKAWFVVAVEAHGVVASAVEVG